MNGDVITEVKQHKYLGILLSDDLNWRSHIDTACNKAKKIGIS